MNRDSFQRPPKSIMLVGYANARSKQHRKYRKQPTMPSGLIGVARICVLRA